MSRLQASLMLIACAAIWGGAFLFQKSAMSHVGPFAFIAARCLLGTLALLPLAWIDWKRPAIPDTPPLRASFVWSCVWTGVAFFVAATGQQVGLTSASVTNSGFLTALYVVLTPLITWALMKRQPSPWVWLGVTLSAAGTWLLGGGRLEAFSHGDRWVAAAAVLWALHVVLVGLGAQWGRASLFTAAQFLVAGLLAFVTSLFTETTTLHALQHAAPAILFVGLLSSALSFTLFTIALRHTQPAEAAIIVSTEALFAAAFAAWQLHEKLPPIGWCGAILIFLATLLVQLSPEKKTLHTPSD